MHPVWGPACDVGERRLLPVVGEPKPERADAAHNRAILLEAATSIVAEQGVDALSMDAVAIRAGVGIGTVYRRFTDLGGLAYALIDDHEKRFQAAFLSGPPPLGPGAPPAERLRAYVHAYVDRLENQGELMSVAERGRYSSGAYSLQHAHVAGLIAAVDHALDAHFLADAILAALSARLYVRQTVERQLSVERVKAGLDQLLSGVLRSC